MKKIFTIISILFLLSGLIPNSAHAQFCGTTSNNGMLNPTTISNNVIASAGTRAAWSFMAAKGDIYNFSTCGATEDTKIRIYDANENLLAEADDYGPFCSSAQASISWTAPSNAMYYVHVANFDCDALVNNVQLNYWLTAGDGYCRSTVNNRDYLYITHVSLNSVSNSSGSNRYANYTDLSTDVIAGESYELSVQLAYGYDNLNVWIDLNNDNDFSDADETLLISSYNSNLATYTLTFPITSAPGNHRMRIQDSYTGNGNAADPCAYIAYGEVEDYTLNILPAAIPTNITPKFLNSPCLSSGKPIEIDLYNNTGSDRTNFNIYATITSPSGIVTNYTYEYTDILAAGAFDIIYDTLVFNEYGDYTFYLWDEIVGTSITKTLSNNPYKNHPYYMDNEVDFNESEFWAHGNQFTKNKFSNRITGNINTSDSIYSPVFSIQKASQFFQYYINSNNLNAGDSIFVQISQECKINFTTIDTVVVGKPGRYNRFDNQVYGMDLTSYLNKKIQFKFLVDAESGFSPYVNLEYVNVFPGYDFVVENIYFDDFTYNINNKYNVGVIIRNNGAKAQANNQVKLTVYGQIPQTLTANISDPIQYDAVDTAIFEVDATQGGIYEFIAEVFAPKDDDNANNTYSNDITLDYAQALPVELDDDFNENNDPADVNDHEDVNFYTLNAYNSGTKLQTDFINRGTTATITSFVFGPITPNTYIAFDYDIESYDNSWNYTNEFGSNDLLSLEISTDYGATFNTLTFVDRDAYNSNFQYQAFPDSILNAHIGKYLVFRIKLNNGTNTSDQTQQIKVNIDNLYIGGAELEIANITSNVNAACGDDNAYFTVELSNNTNVPAKNTKVRLEVTGEFFADTAVEYTFASINPNENVEHNFGPFDISKYGSYQLNAQLFNEQDYDDANNQMYDDFSVYAPNGIPYVQNFNNNPQWSYDNAFYNSGNVATNIIAYNAQASFTTGKIGTISTGDFLVFDYLTYAYDLSENTLGNYIRLDDSIVVYVSDDCGISWNKIYKITSHANVDAFESTSKIALSAYLGKDLRFKITLYKNQEEGKASLYVDNFHVISTGDVRVAAIEFPQYINNIAVCGNVSDQAMVIIENISSNEVSNIPVLLYSVYNEDTTKVEATFTGAIAAYAQDTIYVSGFNTLEAGNYEIIAQTMLEGDLDNTNNENSGNYITVQSLATIPYSYNGASKPGLWQYYPENTDWFSNVDINASGASYLATRYLKDAENAFVTMQKLGPIRTAYMLRMSYNVFTFDDDNTLLGHYFREGDKLEIQVSDNCGQTFTTIQTMDMNNHLNSNDDMKLAIPLDAYANKEIAIRLQIIKGSDIGQIRFAVNQFDITIPAADLALNQVFVEKEVCGKAAQEVFAVVSNVSPFENISAFTIAALVSVNNIVYDELNYSYSGTLEPGDIDTVMIGTFNSETPNDYEIDALVSFANDVNSANDDADFDFTIYEMVGVPYQNDFYNNPVNWLAKQNVYYNAWNRFYTNPIYPGDVAILYSPKFANITISSQLEFDFQEFNEFAIGDKLEVFVSSDCGTNWTLIHTVANTDNLTVFTVDRQVASLTAFAGQDIIVKFQFTNINGDYYQVGIDNFEINHTDIAILGIVNQTDKFDINTYNQNNSTFNFAERYITCGSVTDSIFVVIENQGTTDVNALNVKLETTGKAVNTLTGNFTGILEPGNRAWMYLGDLNTQTPGLLDMRASVTVAQDGNSANDTIGFSVTTQQAFDMPYDAFSSGQFNEAAYWKYDNMGKMTFGYPSGIASIYTPSNLIKDEVAHAISPKVNAAENTWLYFNYYVYNSLGEGHIIHDEVLSVSVLSNCSGTQTEVWRMDVNSTDNTNNGTIALDLSAFAGNQIQIVFKASKGNSDGGFYARMSNIHFMENAPISFTLASSDDLFTETKGAEICESAYYQLYNNLNPVASMSYRYSFSGIDTSYTVSLNSSFNGYMEAYNTGTFTLDAWYTTNPANVFTSTIDVIVNALPTMPEISGDDEVLSNVGTSVYTLTGNHADEYVWQISYGGQISGNETATVVWYEGYIGVSYIYAKGLNVCGFGEEASLMVRVDYLDPQAGSNVADLKDKDNSEANTNEALISAYPNPSKGQFIVNLPEDINHGIMVVKNNLGLEISRTNVTSNKQEISLTSTKPGVYYITIITIDKVFNLPVIIE